MAVEPNAVDPKIWVALIGAAVSLAAAVISLIWGYRNTKRVEELKSELAERRAESDARRDYEYEARKRVYEQCEPLFFQLREGAEDALHRILSLARTARNGHLGHGKDSWIAGDGYYSTSTYYKVFMPLAVYKMIRRRLTLVDLAVDPDIASRFEFAKMMFLAYTDDFEFARIDPELPYDPNIHDWEKSRKADERRHWRQGIAYGRLDTVAESLIVNTGKGDARVMSFGEFETAYRNQDSDVQVAFQVVADMFQAFEPSSRPVLWRILVAQAHLCAGLMESDATGGPKVGPLSPELREALSVPGWTDDPGLGDPIEAAKRYFARHIPDMAHWDAG